MIGYCAIARNGIEMTPIRQMKSATTQAKIGRSMKKLGIRHQSPGRVEGLRRIADFGFFHDGARIDAIAGGKLLEAVDDYPITLLQAVEH